MRHPSIFRTLTLATALACAPLMPALAQEAPQAKAGVEQIKTQVPGYYRFGIGDFVVTALYDGYTKLDRALLKNATEEEKTAYFARAFIVESEGVQTAVNAYLVHTGKELILVDTGAAKKFGETLGNVGDNIRAAGYKAEDVNKVLLTHLHPDHASGLLTPDGKVMFPNATVHVAKAESDYWLDEKNADMAPEGKKGMFALSQEAVAPYQASKKFKTFNGDETIIEGVVSASSAGHTPGHTGYSFTSNGEELLIWGDVVHSHSMQFAKPEISIEFDSDPVAAVASRQRVLADSAARKIWVAGAHLPFPGLGHVRKEETGGYSWVPAEFKPVE